VKISASYNVFDGEELLEKSISSIRDSVDFISVVYQTISNFGNNCSPDLEDILHDLRDKGDVQELVKYTPELPLKPHSNELTKRNIGLNLAKQNSCTHHMSLDCDEFYIHKEFEKAKQIILDEDIDCAICGIQSYYKEPTIIIDPPDPTLVAMIYKINSYSEFKLHQDLGYDKIDPTRRIKSTKVKKFERDQLLMHHMSYIRKDIRSKAENSSARCNFENEIDTFVDYFNNYEEGDAMILGLPCSYHKTKQSKNIFGL